MRKKLMVSFLPRLIQEPVTYHLIRDYNLQVNILRATVRSRERGRMVVEIKGDKKDMGRAFEYMESVGLQVDPLVQEMRYYPERCVHCTTCTTVCPTDALTVDPMSRELVFEVNHCIICEFCIPACPYSAI